jgi:phytanoyl-CoA dioxygenase PhyH
LLLEIAGMAMMRRMGLFCDNVFNRDKYLASLGDRILHFKDTDSAISWRVIDDSVETSDEQDYSVPEVDVSEFSSDFLKKSLRTKGCLIVRNFFSTDEVKAMRSFVDHSFAINCNPDSRVNQYLGKRVNFDAVLAKTRAAIKEKKKENPTYVNTAMFGSKLTQPLGDKKSFLTAQTPILVEKLLNLFDEKGLKTLLQDYFAHDPCVSVYKWALRRSTPPEAPIDFHQDGAFMGDEISSLNCWIPLSNCGSGSDVHGLDVVPKRFMTTFRKGSGVMDWTISEKAVVDAYTEEAIVTPSFREGDIFFFDHLLVHRPQCLPNASGQRYAIETWFFDSVNFPKNQIPIKW